MSQTLETAGPEADEQIAKAPETKPRVKSVSQTMSPVDSQALRQLELFAELQNKTRQSYFDAGFVQQRTLLWLIPSVIGVALVLMMFLSSRRTSDKPRADTALPATALARLPVDPLPPIVAPIKGDRLSTVSASAPGERRHGSNKRRHHHALAQGVFVTPQRTVSEGSAVGLPRQRSEPVPVSPPAAKKGASKMARRPVYPSLSAASAARETRTGAQAPGEARRPASATALTKIHPPARTTPALRAARVISRRHDPEEMLPALIRTPVLTEV